MIYSLVIYFSQLDIKKQSFIQLIVPLKPFKDDFVKKSRNSLFQENLQGAYQNKIYLKKLLLSPGSDTDSGTLSKATFIPSGSFRFLHNLFKPIYWLHVLIPADEDVTCSGSKLFITANSFYHQFTLFKHCGSNINVNIRRKCNQTPNRS